MPEMAGFWADLDSSSGGNIYYQTTGNEPNQQFVVQFTGVPSLENGANTTTYQLVLDEATFDVWVYINKALDPLSNGSAAIGIADQTISLQYSCGAQVGATGQAIHYVHPTSPALYISPKSSSQNGSPNDAIIHTFNVYNRTGSGGDATITLAGSTWGASAPPTVTVAANSVASFDVTVTIPDGASFGDVDSGTATVSLNGQDAVGNFATHALGKFTACELPAPTATDGLWWGAGWDGTCLWVSDSSVDGMNYAFNPLTCEPCSVTKAPTQSVCDVHTCPAAGWYWMADMAYNSTTGEMCEVAVGGNNEIFCWNPVTCACSATTYPARPTSERGLAYRASSDSFFIGGWNTTAIEEVKASDGTNLNGPLTVNLPISGLAYDTYFSTMYVVTNDIGNPIYQMDVSAYPWVVDTTNVINAPGGDSTLAGADYVEYSKGKVGVHGIAVITTESPQRILFWTF